MWAPAYWPRSYWAASYWGRGEGAPAPPGPRVGALDQMLDGLSLVATGAGPLVILPIPPAQTPEQGGSGGVIVIRRPGRWR